MSWGVVVSYLRGVATLDYELLRGSSSDDIFVVAFVVAFAVHTAAYTFYLVGRFTFAFLQVEMRMERDRRIWADAHPGGATTTSSRESTSSAPYWAKCWPC